MEEDRKSRLWGANRRVFLRHGAVSTVGTGATFLAACGTVETPKTDSPSNAAPYKLTFGNGFAAGERLEWAQKATAEFSRINGPQLTAEHAVITGDPLFAAMAGGSGPDVTQTSGSWFSDFADKGQLQDITSYVKRDKVDMSRWYMQDETFIRKGKQYGMPYWQAHAVYLYNKTLFAKHGVRPPDNENWTWTDMLNAAVKLTTPGESFGIQMGFGFEFSWLNFLRSAGEDYVNKERTKTPVNTPGAIEVFQWLVDLVQRHKVHPGPTDTTSLGAGNWWNLGKIGMRLSGTGILGATLTAKPDFEWDMFVTPKSPKTGKRVITANENPMVVTSSTKQPEAGYKLVSFFADKYSQDMVGKYRINMPSLKGSAADTTGWLSPPPADMKLSLEQMKHAGTLSFHLNWLQWYNETQKVLTTAFAGESSVKEACDKAAQMGDTLLKGV
ncbi:MAG: sugar ABC transporter substrate-binding protein [Chloroflexota bacterium]|nr:sugar ABC transporter substrate-binding protein [Chloroflexota bacterium]